MLAGSAGWGAGGFVVSGVWCGLRFFGVAPNDAEDALEMVAELDLLRFVAACFLDVRFDSAVFWKFT